MSFSLPDIKQGTGIKTLCSASVVRNGSEIASDLAFLLWTICLFGLGLGVCVCISMPSSNSVNISKVDKNRMVVEVVKSPSPWRRSDCNCTPATSVKSKRIILTDIINNLVRFPDPLWRHTTQWVGGTCWSSITLLQSIHRVFFFTGTPLKS